MAKSHKITGILILLTSYLLLNQALFAQKQIPAQLDSQTKKELLDSIGKALINYYVFPEKAMPMNEYLRKQMQSKKYDSIISPGQFANVLVKDIRKIYNDTHLAVRYDPELEKRILNFIATKSPDKIDRTNEQRQNFFFKKVEILPANIGYIEFTNFADTSTAARETVRAAMHFVAHTEALILDLRNNFGGNGVMAGEILSYFFKDRTFTGRSFNRIENKWTEQWIENKQAITKGLIMSMPVYVLTSNRTFSAAEGLAYTLQQIKNAIVIGSTTRGGAHLTRSFSLGNGFVGFIPFARSENAVTKTDWEGIGVIPDIKETEANTLLTAQKTILNKQLAAATDENDRRKIIWLLNFHQSKTPATIDKNTPDLAKFAGQFEEFVFSITDNQLLCKNTHQVNKIDKLIPISSTLFQIDNESQVEFILNEKGTYTTIKLYWNDGWVDTITRTH